MNEIDEPNPVTLPIPTETPKKEEFIDVEIENADPFPELEVINQASLKEEVKINKFKDEIIAELAKDDLDATKIEELIPEEKFTTEEFNELHPLFEDIFNKLATQLSIVTKEKDKWDALMESTVSFGRKLREHFPSEWKEHVQFEQRIEEIWKTLSNARTEMINVWFTLNTTKRGIAAFNSQINNTLQSYEMSEEARTRINKIKEKEREKYNQKMGDLKARTEEVETNLKNLSKKTE